MQATMTMAPPARKPFYKLLYVQVLIGILIGGIIGYLNPKLGIALEPLGTGFIKLIKMVITPIIFCTVVAGIAGIQNAQKVGRVGGKALVYFEIVSTLALLLGLIMAKIFEPGSGFPAAGADAAKVDTFIKRAEAESVSQFLLNIIPDSVIGAFAKGDILQVLLFAVLFGFALMALGERGKLVHKVIDDVSHAIFGVVKIIMYLAPLGALGAMAFTIGKFGPAAIGNLVGLIALFYATAIVFIVVVLGLIARIFGGFSIFKLVR